DFAELTAIAAENGPWALKSNMLVTHSTHAQASIHGRQHHGFQFASSLQLAFSDFHVWPTSSPYMLFPTIIQRSHVKDWGVSIRALPNASLCVVDSIELKKSIESKQHEYILVRVRHPDSTRFAIFIVDRCPSSKISIRRLMPSQSMPSGSCSPSSPPAA